MAIINVKKDLVVLEDLAVGTGTIDQERGAGLAQISGRNLPYDDTKSINEELDLKETISASDTKLAGKADINGSATEVFQAEQGTGNNDVVILSKLVADLLLKADLTYVDGQLVLKANANNVMNLDGSTTSPDYSIVPREAPANKGYVLDTVTAIGAGDMDKSTYDTNANGRVDTADGLGVVTDPMGVTPFTQFMRLSQGTLLDCNAVANFGIWVGSGPLNAPTSGAMGLEQLEINGSKAQRAYSFVSFKWYDRVYDAGSNTWSQWNEWAIKADVNAVQANLDTEVARATAAEDANTSLINEVAPIGSIIMWSGTTVPTRWALCDGSNGTPDVTGRFVIGAIDSNIGQTGGSTDAVVVAHTHSFTGDAMPAHGHILRAHSAFDSNVVGGPEGRSMSVPSDSIRMWTTLPTDSSTKADNITSDSAGTPTGTISTDGEDGGGKNLPPYYKLAYIMRIS